MRYIVFFFLLLFSLFITPSVSAATKDHVLDVPSPACVVVDPNQPCVQKVSPAAGKNTVSPGAGSGGSQTSSPSAQPGLSQTISSAPSNSPSPSTTPCTTSQSSVSEKSVGTTQAYHHHWKHHHSSGGGFLQQFILFLLQFLLQLFQQLGIQIPGVNPCGTTTSPSTTPSTAPSLGAGGGNGTVSGSPSSAAPSNASPSSGSATGVLAQWKNALADRSSKGATWVALGDSITEGQGSSTVAGRWANQALTALRSKYSVSGVTGGFGYIPAFYGTYGPDSQWSTDPTLSGSASENTAKDDGNDGQSFGNGPGLGMLTITLQSGGSETFKVTGSSIDILYNYGSGTFSYKVDSGAATNVSTSGGSGAAGSKHVAFSSAGSHTVTISGVSGSVILEGIMTYNGDEAKGIRQYVGAQSGVTSGDFAAQAKNMAAVIANVKADLVTIEIGGNDYNRSSGTPTQTTANIKALISDIRSAATGHEPSIVIIQVYPISGGNDSQGFPYSAYASAIKSVATSDTSLGFLDFGALGVTAGQPSQYLSSTDNLHPSNAGQAKLATIVESYLEGQ